MIQLNGTLKVSKKTITLVLDEDSATSLQFLPEAWRKPAILKGFESEMIAMGAKGYTRFHVVDEFGNEYL